jgi:GH35 family endo-1,4-beta-xylanase
MGAGVQAALEQLASASVNEVAITELDIAYSPEADYTAVVQACLNVEKCSAITVWGISDKVSSRRFCEKRYSFMLTYFTGLLEAGRGPSSLRCRLQPQARL